MDFIEKCADCLDDWIERIPSETVGVMVRLLIVLLMIPILLVGFFVMLLRVDGDPDDKQPPADTGT